MATYTPPPYFPQGSLAPPDESRYRKFKLIVIGIVALVVILLAVIGVGVYYLVRAVW